MERRNPISPAHQAAAIFVGAKASASPLPLPGALTWVLREWHSGECSSYFALELHRGTPGQGGQWCWTQTQYSHHGRCITEDGVICRRGSGSKAALGTCAVLPLYPLGIDWGALRISMDALGLDRKYSILHITHAHLTVLFIFPYNISVSVLCKLIKALMIKKNSLCV